MADVCLTLICPPTIEEKLLDLLLERSGDGLFTSMPAHSHGISTTRLSAQEQVMGRSRAVQVQVLLADAQLEGMRRELTTEFAGTGLRYWVTSVTEQGECA